MPDLYLPRLVELLQRAGEKNADALDAAADRFATSIAGDGLLHLFGSGHSVLPCQEAFLLGLMADVEEKLRDQGPGLS